MKLYLQAPLPFMGQKRRFARPFIKLLKTFPERATFVDLFGGSGLLSHIAKRTLPAATVVYNDYDNYRQRLANIPQTNALLADIRTIIGGGAPRHKRLNESTRRQILSRIERERGFVDYITLSSSLLFSMNYVKTLEALRKEPFYNVVRTVDFPPCDDYLDGIETVSLDYKELFARYKDTPGVVFLVDPPYLATESSPYKMSWSLADYLDVLKVLQGRSFVYFTSDKSAIIELCEWMAANPGIGNPFDGAGRLNLRAQVNYSSKFTDIMLFKKATNGV